MRARWDVKCGTKTKSLTESPIPPVIILEGEDETENFGGWFDEVATTESCFIYLQKWLLGKLSEIQRGSKSRRK